MGNFLKKLLFVGLTILISLPSVAQDSVFLYTYGGIKDEVCNQIRATPDGGYIMIGTTNSFGAGANDFYAIKVDSVGKHQWSKTYGGPADEEGYSVVPTLDKGYAFLGWTDSYGVGGYDAFLVKTDSAGNVQWQKTYGGTGWDFGYSLKQTKDSGYVLCGQTFSAGIGNGQVFIVRTDKNGIAQWSEAVGDSGYSIGNSVCLMEDSIYIVAGATTSFGAADTSMYFIKINNKGTVEKDTIFGWKDSTYAAYGINNAIRYKNGLLVTGYSCQVGAKPFIQQLLLDSNLRFHWEYPLPYPTGYGKDIKECPDGTYISAATSDFGGHGGYEMVTLNENYGSQYSWWQNGPFEGGIQDDEGNSCDYNYVNNNVAFAGATDSYSDSINTAGLNDFFMVRYKGCAYIQPDHTLKHIYSQFIDSLPVTVGINEQSNAAVMTKVFPNPVTDVATVMVQDETGKCTFSLYDVAGQCIINNILLKSAGHGQMMAHFSKGDLQPGIYFYRINVNDNRQATGKIIVE